MAPSGLGMGLQEGLGEPIGLTIQQYDMCIAHAVKARNDALARIAGNWVGMVRDTMVRAGEYHSQLEEAEAQRFQLEEDLRVVTSDIAELMVSCDARTRR